jgi:hypothetical protein
LRDIGIAFVRQDLLEDVRTRSDRQKEGNLQSNELAVVQICVKKFPTKNSGNNVRTAPPVVQSLYDPRQTNENEIPVARRPVATA